MTEHLRPSKSLLDSLGYDSSSEIVISEFNGICNKTREHVALKVKEWNGVVMKSFVKMVEKYGMEVAREMFSPMWEAVQNAGIHGCRNGEKFTLYQYLCQKGIASGIQDSGAFMRNPSTKNQLESRIPLSEEQFDKEFSLGARIGVNLFIYKFSDRIEVDSDNGVLWIAKYTPKFI